MTIIKTAPNRLVITRKMSGTGSIHDLAHDQFDRMIKFAPGCRFAVILPAYYGGRGYTTHKTVETAAAECRKLQRMGYQSIAIVDADGIEHN